MRKIGLVGGPNSGKTTLFNILTGLNQKTGNFPGVTVDKKTAGVKLDETETVLLTDLPGCYSIYPKSEDERIVSGILRQRGHPDFPDELLLVADVTNIERALVLCSQLIEMGFPLRIVLNMTDLVEKNQTEFILNKVRSSLGIEIIDFSARSGKGIAELKHTLKTPAENPSSNGFEIPAWANQATGELKQKLNLPTLYHAWQALLDRGNYCPKETNAINELSKKHKINEPESLITNELVARIENIKAILGEGSGKSPLEPDFSWKADRFLLHPIWGYVIFLALMTLVFQSIFSWASYPMGWLDSAFSLLGQGIESFLPEGFLSDLIVNGILAGLGGIIIFVPQIAFLFLFIALMEESGYMSRVVFLMDRLLSPFGLSGKSVIPMVGGLACAVPSIIVARNIENPARRLITIMVTPLMSCSARIPVYTLLIGMFIPSVPIAGIFNLQGLVMLGFYLLGIIMALLVAWVMSKLMRATADRQFITELPLYRLPSAKSILVTIYNKCKSFITEAGKVIIVVSIALWFLASFGPTGALEKVEKEHQILMATYDNDPYRLEELRIRKNARLLHASWAGRIGTFIEPAIRPLGYDWKIGIALVTSFAAREVFVGTMATLYSLEEEGMDFKTLQDRMMAEINPKTGKPVYTLAVGLSLLVFYAFAIQCMSTLAVVKKETKSWKWTLIMTTYLSALAYFSALIVFQIFS